MGISPREAADRLGVSRQRVNRLILAGRIKAKRLGESKTWIVDERSVEKYATERKEVGRPEAA